MKIVPGILSLRLATAKATSYKNVYGDELQSCSSDGMALTGFTLTGYCVDEYDDQGSHHICIDMSSASGGNFCDVTGQSDWCSSLMPCQEDQDTYCQIEQWCVCQWAFASYIENAGGCDYIQKIVCEAINMEALLAYEQQAGSSSKYQDALDCLVERCQLDLRRKVYQRSVVAAIRGGVLVWTGLAASTALVSICFFAHAVANIRA